MLVDSLITKVLKITLNQVIAVKIKLMYFISSKKLQVDAVHFKLIEQVRS